MFVFNKLIYKTLKISFHFKVYQDSISQQLRFKIGPDRWAAADVEYTV